MIQETVLPVLAVAAFACAYRAMNAPPEYTGFLVLGAALTTFWLNVLWGMGAQLYWERDSGNLELYVMAPAPMTAILTGMALGGMATTSIRALAITLAGVLIFDVTVAPTVNWWIVGLGFGVTLAALYGLGMLFASVFLLWGREAWHLVSLLQEPVYLLSGTNFPITVLPRLVAVAASAIPLTLGLDALRQELFGTRGLFAVWIELCTLGGLAVVFFFAARWGLRYLERRAREEGKLTIRWQ
jgi:ABC-2 type transport system permease protein